jgi:hypothetical protein
MTPLDDAAAARLLAAIDACDPAYDEVFLEVSERIDSAKSAGKLDLAALINWKQGGQGKWVKSLLATAETDVRAVTRRAFGTEGGPSVLRVLGELDGFGSHGPMATVLMTAFNPVDWGVLDVRACEALPELGRPIGRQPASLQDPVHGGGGQPHSGGDRNRTQPLLPPQVHDLAHHRLWGSPG